MKTMKTDHPVLFFCQVVNEIKQCNYDAEEFTVAISLPVSLALRTHSLNILLSEKLSNFNTTEVLPIKQVWKWVFSSRLQKGVGMKYSTGDNCQFFVELEILFEQDEPELEFL